MAKTSSIYVCQQCGYRSPNFLGKCPECGTWNSLVEQVENKGKVQSEKAKRGVGSGEIINTRNIEKVNFNRLKTGIDEFDRVLGGGVVLGSLVLLGGDPGIGKSTLLLQSLVGISKNKDIGKILYISGEESAQQIKLRAERLKIKEEKIFLLAENDLENIIATIETERPNLVIVDSIQTVFSGTIASA